MEYLVIAAVAAVFLAAVLEGYHRGFVKIILSLVATLVSFLLAIVLTDPIANLVKQSDIYENLKASVSETICQGLAEEGVDIQDIEDLVSRVELPGALSEPIAETVIESLTQDFQELSQVDAASLTSVMVEKIADFLLELIIFLILFILISLVVRLIIMVADFVTKIPGLNLLNHILGAVFGAIQGILLIWIASMILTVFASTEFGMQILAVVSENAVLNWIYSHNLLWNFVISLI